MNDQETGELQLLFYQAYDEDAPDLITKWVEAKKKEWQNEAYMKGYTDTEEEYNEMFKDGEPVESVNK